VALAVQDNIRKLLNSELAVAQARVDRCENTLEDLRRASDQLKKDRNDAVREIERLRQLTNPTESDTL
jgi:predicted  nucleic acid-binding Zn-ribbon protein